MYIVNVPIQIEKEFKEQFVAGIKENASSLWDKLY